MPGPEERSPEEVEAWMRRRGFPVDAAHPGDDYFESDEGAAQSENLIHWIKKDEPTPSPPRLLVWGIKAGLGEPFDIPPGWRFVAHLYTETYPDSSYVRLLLEAV